MQTQELTVDKEFKFLLLALDEETFASLEENILQNGIRDPLVLWGNTIIDGHNRFAIATKHDLLFSTVSMEFDSRDDVIIWIISTQVSRRNLTPMQLTYYRGTHYLADKRIQGANKQHSLESEKSQNATFTGSTAGRLAKHYKVSRDTILRDSKIAGALTAIGKTSPEAKAKILSGEVRLNKNHLQVLSAGAQDDITDVASRIEDGTFERKKPAVITESGEGSYPGQEEMDPLVTLDPLVSLVIRITSGFYSDLRAFTGDHGATELKSPLRAYIDVLEDLYRQM